jgi:hypothetical protein
VNPSYDNIFSPLSEVDWNFDAVPDSEIIACCLWEYARESITIGMAADEHWCNVRGIRNGQRYKLEPETKAAHDEEAAHIQKRLKASGFNYDEFSDRFWNSDLAAVEFYQSIKEHVMNGARAWQQIPAKSRLWLNNQVSESHIIHPLAPATVEELEKLWNANRGDLDKIRSKPRPENDDSEDCALYQSSEPVILEVEPGKPAGGSMAVAFAIDFARFTDHEILTEFKKWLAARRPKHWQRPLRMFPSSSARGKKLIEYRVALERLGLMRLLHWHPPSEIPDLWPEAWKKYRRKQGSFRREVRQAGRFFKKLFPFLPATEGPSSEERHSVWMKSMDEALDEHCRGKCEGVRA